MLRSSVKVTPQLARLSTHNQPPLLVWEHHQPGVTRARWGPGEQAGIPAHCRSLPHSSMTGQKAQAGKGSMGSSIISEHATSGPPVHMDHVIMLPSHYVQVLQYVFPSF